MNRQTAHLVRGALRGTVDVEERPTGLLPLRLPMSARAQSDSDWMWFAAEQASGVRCEFWTAATWIELTVHTTGLHLPWVPEQVRWAVFAATVGGEAVEDARVTGGSELHLAEPGGPRFVQGEPVVVRFELGGTGLEERRVTIWLPQTDTVEIRDVRADLPLSPAEPIDQLRWWHHGSSISHCIEAETPRGVWPVAAADRLDLDVTNLGFAANAHLDPFTARAMRDSGADLFSLKIGINIVGGDTMKRRTFIPAVHGFLDTVREGAPTAPILVISPILCPMHEDTPGPTVTDPETGERHGTPSTTPDVLEPPLTLRAVREILRDIVHTRSVEDPNLLYLDGLELLGADDVAELPDGLHPSPAGYLLIADRFAASPVVSAWIGESGPKR
ncbi:GDSL-type esterase/lipase family protein [Microbacterium pygmaeum]|uniref:GDSL-like Lipase/Acylhydrolase family protein n=1 Tax=Microbacterium pygmaeum TaxID=370764 RepID=A0A1G7VFB2_9MICO|nr:GDSL-type esterase/lipase family protein [Microbacterium pygmaeum]SDG58505.1 GDSL-like Lipase/Acylhydrolase family protein [Microbacterium pygmaeum]